MKRFGMTLAAASLALVGLGLGRDAWTLAPAAVIMIALLWTAVEAHLALTRPFEGQVPRHPLIAASRWLWLAAVVYGWLDVKRGWTWVALPAGVVSTICALLLVSLVLRVWAVRTLGASFCYDVRRPTAGRLLRRGPYRIVRHPGYLAIAVLGSLPALALGSVLGAVLMTLCTIPQTAYRTMVEDRLLAELYGDEFRRYAAHTWRLMPGIW